MKALRPSWVWYDGSSWLLRLFCREKTCSAAWPVKTSHVGSNLTAARFCGSVCSNVEPELSF
jgi:hypothetical protein